MTGWAVHPPVSLAAAITDTPFELDADQIVVHGVTLKKLATEMDFDSATVYGLSIKRRVNGHTLTITSDGPVEMGSTHIQSNILGNLINDINVITQILGTPSDWSAMGQLLLTGHIDELTFTNFHLIVDKTLETKSITMPNIRLQFQ
jgi:hypothetical protein